MSYIAPVKDMLFDIEHLADIAQIARMPGLEDAGLETAQAVLEECARFNEQVIAPLNAEGDRKPSWWKDGHVTTTPGFKEAFRTRNEQGQTQLVFIQTNRDTFIELGQANAQRPAGFTHVGIHVESMPQAVKLYQSRGLMVSEPRLSVPVGSTQANITDPNGLRIELTELPPNSLQRKAMEAWK